MKINPQNFQTSFSQVKEKSTWNNESSKELRMHKIHLYPAKFPAFLISKSLEYAEKKRVEINSMGDIFCGCGTTALEAKRNNKEFWGCDINPVATLIASVKRQKFNITELEEFYNQIIFYYCSEVENTPEEIKSNERIKYWFEPSQIDNLYNLLAAIRISVPLGIYRDFFLVAFSNILKRSSKWLTKSIKPTIDKKKPLNDVICSFNNQFKFMYKAVQEINEKISDEPPANIVTTNFLNLNREEPFLDMLICSPPYVTSYEYADLHQLSTLWLGYAKDFRELRDGTIGSVYHKELDGSEVDSLNEIGKDIYSNLLKVKAKRPKSILKYFLDMNSTVQKSYTLINTGGFAFFVIGNTSYKSAYVDNAKYLTKCMLDTGFNEIEVFKRKISSKMLTPYRDKTGKFSNDKRHRKVYNYEYIIIARKP